MFNLTNLFSIKSKYSQGVCGNGAASNLMAAEGSGEFDGDHGDE